MAKARGFRILKDARVEPPRALVGLFHVGLPKIEAALLTPPPPPRARTRKAKPVTEASHPSGNGAPEITTMADLLMRLGDAL
jgi:hypothetical protein